MGSNFAGRDFDVTFKVLVIGGSYSGLSAALNVIDLCSGRRARCGGQSDPLDALPPTLVNVQITVVDERDGFYHLIGSPLALASEQYAEKAWVKFDDIPALRIPNLRVLHGSASRVDCHNKIAIIAKHGTEQTEEVSYDYLVTATGLRRVWPVVPQSLRRKQYLFETSDHIREVADAQHGVVVVGGGAVGIEMAAELKLMQPHVKVTLVHSRSKLLSAEPLPDSCKDIAFDLTREAGVEVLLEHRLEKTSEVTTETGAKAVEITFANGHTMVASKVIMAVSKSIPSTEFLPKPALDGEGYVRIHPSLAFPSEIQNSASHYAVGDLVSWSGIKRCGAAMHMGYYAAYNIHQLMLQRLSGHEPKFMELSEIPPMIGLAVGRKAVSHGPEGTNSGEDVMKIFFGDDLGFNICWNWLQLGGQKVV